MIALHAVLERYCMSSFIRFHGKAFGPRTLVANRNDSSRLSNTAPTEACSKKMTRAQQLHARQWISPHFLVLKFYTLLNNDKRARATKTFWSQKWTKELVEVLIALFFFSCFWRSSISNGFRIWLQNRWNLFIKTAISHSAARRRTKGNIRRKNCFEFTWASVCQSLWKVSDRKWTRQTETGQKWKNHEALTSIHRRSFYVCFAQQNWSPSPSEEKNTPQMQAPAIQLSVALFMNFQWRQTLFWGKKSIITQTSIDKFPFWKSFQRNGVKWKSQLRCEICVSNCSE